jgi:hypothetical protein
LIWQQKKNGKKVSNKISFNKKGKIMSNASNLENNFNVTTGALPSSKKVYISAPSNGEAT